MNFKINIKIIGFSQIIQTVFIVLLYNVLAVAVFKPEIINGDYVPSLTYIFSSQIIGFLLSSFSFILLYKIYLPENFFSFKFNSKGFALLAVLLIASNLSIALYQGLIVELIPKQFLASYYAMQNELSQGYTNLSILLSDYHPSLLYLVVALLPAICEEFFFRGFLQNLALKYYSPSVSIILVSLIFAIFHFQLIAFVPLFLLGLALGFLTYKTDRLIYSIILHFINNSVTLYLINMA